MLLHIKFRESFFFFGHKVASGALCYNQLLMSSMLAHFSACAINTKGSYTKRKKKIWLEGGIHNYTMARVMGQNSFSPYLIKLAWMSPKLYSITANADVSIVLWQLLSIKTLNQTFELSKLKFGILQLQLKLK